MPPVDFQALFDASPNSYMLLDRQLRYVAANPAYLKATASRLEDLLGREIFDAFPHDPADPANASATMLRESFERVLASGKPDVIAVIPYRVPRFTDDGGVAIMEERFWSATHTPVLDETGEVTHILQHTVDVTEVHQLRDGAAAAGRHAGLLSQIEAGVLGRAQRVQETNASLDIERRHLQRLFEQAPGFMCFLRGDTYIFEIANGAYYQLVGHREVLGKTVREALPEIEGQGIFELLDRVYATGEPFTGRGVRVVLQREPGGPLDEAFLDFSYQPIADSSGNTAGILVHGYDITTEKRQAAEHAALLRRERAARAVAEAAEAQQRFLAEAIPQQVWTAGPNGELDFVNQRVLEYFGAPEREVLGAGWQAVIHPDDLPDCMQRWGNAIRTGEEYEAEFRLRRADGMYRWHLGRALALRNDDDGRIVKWFGTNTDMDELKRARDELQKRAEFDQQLIAIVSHDLRNPLNAIGMATSLLLQRGQLDEQHVKIVTRIMSSSERAVRLIRDFLDFTQARVSGRIPVTPEPANIRELARQVFDEVHLTYAGRKATIEHSGEETGKWDPDRIAQVIGNLVGNAFQHSPDDGVVRLTTRGGPTEVTIEVHNAGTPITSSDRARLFEPFQRGSQARPDSARSVGLGLYISKQIVAAHGGTIEVESTTETGTRFIVRLPRDATATSAS